MDLVEFGASFDWITPVITIAQNLANGPHHTFLVPDDCGRSGADIAGLLKRRGVHTWGHMVVNGSIMLNVKLEQAAWAQYLLESEGISLESAPPKASRSSRQAGRPAPQPGAPSTSTPDDIFRAFDWR